MATLADDLALARAVTVAVRSVPGVAGLSREYPDAATYGPAEIIHGVTIARSEGATQCGIHLVARYPAGGDLRALASQVREAARQAMATIEPSNVAQVDVAIDALITGDERP